VKVTRGEGSKELRSCIRPTTRKYALGSRKIRRCICFHPSCVKSIDALLFR
jgi:hypothetical protein